MFDYVNELFRAVGLPEARWNRPYGQPPWMLRHVRCGILDPPFLMVIPHGLPSQEPSKTREERSGTAQVEGARASTAEAGNDGAHANEGACQLTCEAGGRAPERERTIASAGGDGP